MAVFSIYYIHYGKDEILATKKLRSANDLTRFLIDSDLLDLSDDYKWLNNISIKINMMKYMSDHIFNNRYEHTSYRLN